MGMIILSPSSEFLVPSGGVRRLVQTPRPPVQSDPRSYSLTNSNGAGIEGWGAVTNGY